MRESFKSLLSGITQGGILGPLLFVICSSDLLPTVMHLVECSIFADDAELGKYILKMN